MLSVAFDARVADTLREVGALGSPVLRSCHVGNNGSYNFGWLALARNTCFVMYDHTTYGADRVCHPWMVVGDGGRIEQAFDLDGHERPELAGLHVSAPQAQVPVRHRSVLNHGIQGLVEGSTPLATWHYCRNLQRALAVNGRAPTFDSELLLDNFDLVERLVRSCWERSSLDVLFDRWVSVRRGRSQLHRVGALQRDGSELRALGTDGARLFTGTLPRLLDDLQCGLRAVVERVKTGLPVPDLGYPWLRLQAAYLFGAAVEHRRDPGQRRFFHAGGLTSPYYMEAPDFRAAFERMEAVFADAGLLPQPMAFMVIPIGACQFFARRRHAALLDDLFDALARLSSAAGDAAQQARALRTLGSHLDEGRVPRLPLLDDTSTADQERVRQCTREFNLHDANTLPSCLRVGDATGFTRYGADGLGGGGHETADELHFPERLTQLQWGEAEWMLQALGELFATEPEAASCRAGGG